MPRNIRIVLIALFWITINVPLLANSYYVDKNASGNNDGSSWLNAWIRLGDINWSLIQPGDRIYISGGSNNKIYTTDFMYIGTMGNSGTPSHPIIITKGEDTGHDGSVIFDGQNSLPHGIQLDGKDYVTIQNIEFRNFTGTGGVHIDHATGVTVKNCGFLVTSHGGVFIQRSNSCRIRNNIITTPNNSDAQTDGIYSQLNSDNIYEGNNISISNQNINPHCDGIQLYVDNNITVRNNYIEQDNNKPYNAQGIYATNCFGKIVVYNNVVYAPNTENALLTLAIFSEGNARLIAHHNTLVGGGWGTLHLMDAPNSVVQNNIFIIDFPNGWAFRLSGQLPAGANINYNVYFAPNSSSFTYYNSAKTWTEWQDLGFEADGLNTDPLLINIGNGNFMPASNSPIIDRGINLGSEFSVDIDGTVRPQGNGWDIGAYEVLISNVTIAPPKNLKVTIIY